MKGLLKLIYLVLLLVIIFLLAGIFLPKNYSIFCKITTTAHKGIVFEQVNKLKNWEKWSPWLTKDSLVKLEYNSVESGRGAECNWSTDSDRSKFTITKSIENATVEGEIDFADYGSASINFSLVEENGDTQITLDYLQGDLKFFERYFMFIFRKKIEKELNIGLKRIEEIAEELRLSRISDPETIVTEKIALMVIIDTTTLDEFNSKQTKAYDRLTKYLERRDIEIIGDPVSIFYKWDPEGETIFASGYIIPKRTWGWKDYVCLEINATEIATLTHWGDYSSGKPYLALDEYLKNNNLQQDSFIWETYQVSPKDEMDTSLWQKQLFYPIKTEATP